MKQTKTKEEMSQENADECGSCGSELISLDETGFTCNNCGARYELMDEVEE